MIQGVAILPASQMRAPIETTTRKASVSAAALGGLRTDTRRRSAHAGLRVMERSMATADLPKACGDVAQCLAVGRKPGLLSRTRNLAHERIPDCVSAGRLLDRRYVGLGDSAEPVLALGHGPCGVADARTQLRIAREPLQRVRNRANFLLAHGHLDDS